MGQEASKTSQTQDIAAMFFVKQSLPLNAKEIGLEWPIEEGGIGVTARTDSAGLPYIGLYPLSPNGNSTGYVVEFTRERLMTNIVAGYVKGHAILVFIDVEVTVRGLHLRVVMPPAMLNCGYDRSLSARWGTKSPHHVYGFVSSN